MCGIVGFKCNRDFRFLREALPGAAFRLSHRGPDDSGVFFDEQAGIGLAHQRLSILDLSKAGHQPMTSDDGSVVIVHNGEVYNFREIRTALKRYGHTFRSFTDTEVILKAYLQWGIDCVQRFVGMFSFALWDSRKQCLFLVRDRLGIKPLYYHLSRGTFLFASELKAIMAFRNFERDIDPESIPLFLHYQYIPAPGTVFKDTYKLLPGHYLTYDGKNIRTHTYWNLPQIREDSEFADLSEQGHVSQLDRLLTQAVSDRLISDVPLGGLLSGGIDSSLVVAIMQKVSTAPVRTFSIGFRENRYNEAPWAARVARHLGTDHTELYVSPREALEVIAHLPDSYDEPFADSSAIPTFLVCKMARSHVTVALSGDGGDEQFSGYVRYWSTRAMATRFQRLPGPLKKTLLALCTRIPPAWVEKCYLPYRRFLPQRLRVANFPDKWSKLVSQMGHTGISELYRMAICLWSVDELKRLTGQSLPQSMFEETFKDSEGLPILSRLMRVDQRTYLPDAMLTKIDRASMAVSLEVRVPLLDHRIVEYTSQVPESLKYSNGKGKYLLKKVLSNYMPTELFERPKMGFGVPIDQWLRNELKPLVLDYLSAERLRKEGLFDQDLIEKTIKEHLSGQCNHHHRLWSVLMWEMWRDRWLYGT